MQADTAQPAAPAALSREAVAAALLAGGADTEQLIAWAVVELARQGDFIDRLTALLPAAEQAARLMNNPAAAAVARAASVGRRRGGGRSAAAVDLRGS
jgi:hypothetical protein